MLPCALLIPTVLFAAAKVPEQAVLQHRIPIPLRVLSEAPTRNPSDEQFDGGSDRFVGDIRIGDLDGDGCPEFVLAKAVGGLKTTYIAAFNWHGEFLWEWGDAKREAESRDADNVTYVTEPPIRPGPLLVADTDGDGRCEVATVALKSGVNSTSWWEFDDMEFILLDGRTGEVRIRAAPEELRKANGYDDLGNRHRANYVHQRLIAADFRGIGHASDFAIKIGNTVLALDSEFNVLWTYHNRFSKYGEHSSYIPCVGDVDSDGRDELLGGNYLIDHDGTVHWEGMMANHNDSVAIADWDGDPSNGQECILSGFGQVVDASGDVILKLGAEIVPHGQEIRCARIRDDVPGLQLAIRHNGHTRDIIVAGRDGNILERLKVPASPINVGLAVVHWDGPDALPLLYSPCALFDGHGRERVTFPDLPPYSGKGRMGWLQAIPAVLDGSGRESLVLFDSWGSDILVYGKEPLKENPPKGYKQTRDQANVRFMD